MARAVDDRGPALRIAGPRQRIAGAIFVAVGVFAALLAVSTGDALAPVRSTPIITISSQFSGPYLFITLSNFTDSGMTAVMPGGPIVTVQEQPLLSRVCRFSQAHRFHSCVAVRFSVDLDSVGRIFVVASSSARIFPARRSHSS